MTLCVMFLGATVCSLIANLLANYTIYSVKKEPKLLFAFGLFFALTSSLFMQDYRNTNTFEEKVANLDLMRNKLLVGLTFTSVGFSLNRVGISE